MLKILIVALLINVVYIEVSLDSNCSCGHPFGCNRDGPLEEKNPSLSTKLNSNTIERHSINQLSGRVIVRKN